MPERIPTAHDSERDVAELKTKIADFEKQADAVRAGIEESGNGRARKKLVLRALCANVRLAADALETDPDRTAALRDVRAYLHVAQNALNTLQDLVAYHKEGPSNLNVRLPKIPVFRV